MLSPSSTQDEDHLQQPMTSDQHRNSARKDDNKQLCDGNVFNRSCLRTGDDREQMMQQDVLNGDDMETHSMDARHEQSEIQSAQAQENHGDAENLEVSEVSDSLAETNKSVGNRLEASAQNGRPQADDYTAYCRQFGDNDLAVEEITTPLLMDAAINMTADLDDSEAVHCNALSSSPTSSSLDFTAANSGTVQPNNNSQSFHIPDIISTHEMVRSIPAEPSLFFCASSESPNLMERCACADNDDCPKRDASIFTELVADVGGCLCSKSDVRDRLPQGWPDVFYPLPDLIASQRSFESQSHSRTEMTLGKTILVTGGAGYVGSHAVIELVEAGYDIVVVDNLVNASMESIRRVEKIVSKNKKITSYSVDLLNKPALEEVFRKHSIHAVIHFAGLKAVGESCEVPLLYYKNNVGGTTNLLEVMEAHGVYNLVFSSSATVYGTPQFLPLTESHPVGGCTSPYGKTKYMVEEMLCDISASSVNWNFIILRYFNPVGAHKSGTMGEDPSGVPNNLMPFIGQVAVGRRPALKVYGSDYDTRDGTGVRDYIHVVDLAKGHLAALRKLDERCGLKIYNLGTGQGCTVLEMVRAFEKASGKKIPYELAPRRLGDVPTLLSDPSLAERELGWRAKKGLDEMCEDLWRWQSNNPHGYNTDDKK